MYRAAFKLANFLYKLNVGSISDNEWKFVKWLSWMDYRDELRKD